MIEIIICFFKHHKWELVLCSKNYTKSLMVCRRCGISWWFTRLPKEDEIQDSLYLKRKEIL